MSAKETIVVDTARAERRQLARRRLREIAPVVALAVAVALPALTGRDLASTELVEARHLQIEEAVADVPIGIGSWIGIDEPVPAGTEELLRPTALLGRWFMRGGSSAREAGIGIYVIHCSDARDMGSHYPPVCYKGQGWIRAWGDSAPTCTVEFGGRAVEASVYDFGRESVASSVGEGRRHRRVLNFFIRPDGTTHAGLPTFNRLKERYRHGGRGVAQVHVVVDADAWTLEDTIETANELFAGLGELPEALGVTPQVAMVEPETGGADADAALWGEPGAVTAENSGEIRE